MRRPDARVVVAVVLNAVTWSEAIVCPQILGVTLVVQLLTGVAIVSVIRHERQALGAAVAIALPIIGPLATAWLDRTRGAGGGGLLAEPEEPAEAVDGADVARRLVSAPPPCEAIVSGDVESRRAAIARLAERAGADDVSILRWARTQEDPDVAVEAALALEDIGERFERRLAVARAIAEESPTAEHHGIIVQGIADAVSAGFIDATSTAKLVAEACERYDEAVALDEHAEAALAVPRARIELAADRPQEALALLEPVLATAKVEEHLVQLYNEAAYAARHFDRITTVEHLLNEKEGDRGRD